jgi:hypothetical protein
MGTEVKWADIVALFVDENGSAVPYLVIEVKTAFGDMNAVLAQTDSYAKLLDTQYFAVTDGKSFMFYQRRPSGGYIKISGVPIPDKPYMTVTSNTKFKPGFILCGKPSMPTTQRNDQYDLLDTKIEDYFNMMATNQHYLGKSREYSLRHDITSHYCCIKSIHELMQMDIDSLKQREFKDNFDSNIMCYKKPNITKIYREVETNFEGVRSFLKFIRDFKGDPEENLNRLYDTSDQLHINGVGPFIVSQYLAGAHPTRYAVIEDRMVDTMKELGLIDTKVKSANAKGYLYTNEVCIKLYNEVFRNKIEKNKSKLGFQIDEDFGLVFIHEFFWEFEEFNGYDPANLEEATGQRLKIEEERTQANLETLKQLM